MKIRFMCDASDNNDDVYVDNVRITASTVVSPNNYITPLTRPELAENGAGEAGPVTVYPNPAFDDLTINIADNKLSEIFLYDMQGRVVYHEIVTDPQHTIDIKDYTSGVYMVFIITPDETFKTKFIKR
jgi:hypothetical protein